MNLGKEENGPPPEIGAPLYVWLLALAFMLATGLGLLLLTGGISGMLKILA